MAKAKTQYVCTECGGTSPKWQGQCPHCNAWNTLGEVARRGGGRASVRAARADGGGAVAEAGAGEGDAARALGHRRIRPRARRRAGRGRRGPDRRRSGHRQVDAAAAVARRAVVRARRCSTSAARSRRRRSRCARAGSGWTRAACGCWPRSRSSGSSRPCCEEKPAVVVIDSIQTVYSEQLQSAPGSVAQVRECAAQLTRMAKQAGLTLILVGHVTKEGALAGPRVLEHMVDTVLYFEGDTHSSFRLIRAFKNRFGAVNELGVFAMTDRGLKGVSNPSALFLSQHDAQVRRVVRHGDAGGHAAAAGRGPGAGRHRPRPESAPPVGRARSEAARDAARGAASPRRHRRLRPGRVRQRGRRRAHRRAGGRPGGAARDRLLDAQQAAAARTGRVRRGRPGRRDPAGAARPGAAARGGEARLLDGADPAGRTRPGTRSRGSR